jgi:hypothetical protein
MNRDKLIEMLMQSGFEYTSDLISKIDKFENLLEIERKECMDLCMNIEQTKPLTDRIGWEHGTVDCAFAISRRGSDAKS